MVAMLFHKLRVLFTMKLIVKLLVIVMKILNSSEDKTVDSFDDEDILLEDTEVIRVTTMANRTATMLAGLSLLVHFLVVKDYFPEIRFHATNLHRDCSLALNFCRSFSDSIFRRQFRLVRPDFVSILTLINGVNAVNAHDNFTGFIWCLISGYDMVPDINKSCDGRCRLACFRSYRS